MCPHVKYRQFGCVGMRSDVIHWPQSDIHLTNIDIENFPMQLQFDIPPRLVTSRAAPGLTMIVAVRA